MMIWKTSPVVIATAGTEVTVDLLGYQAGRQRRIKFIAGPKTANLRLRAYRTSEQVVDFDTNLFTTGYVLLPVDVLLKEGDTLKAGFKDFGAGAATYNVAIGYEEAD
jgi:hypothetical protein